jgi:hypothetical protein
MFVEDRASVEAVLDERDPSKLRIDIRVHPIGSGSLGSEAGEIQRAIREGFRDALRETQLERLMVAPNPRPKRRGWFANVLGFFLCVGLGSAATFLLTATHPRPTAVAASEDLGSAVASPGSQSDLAPPPFVRPEPSQLPQLQSPAAGGAAASEPGPGVFGLHQQ